MIEPQQIDRIQGAAVMDPDGDKIGTVEQVYIDPPTGNPVWAAVRTGLFGIQESFVPLDDATLAGSDVHVSYSKDFVKDAPRVDADGALSDNDTDALFVYYKRDDTVGGDTPGQNTDATMTRSEEQLHVGTEKVQTGRARLHKYVVTEEKTVTVPVTREEVRLETEPITDGNVGDARGGSEIGEDDQDVVLTEERVVVNKETVPVERVRLAKDTVTEQEQVTEEVREERVELEDPTGEQRR